MPDPKVSQNVVEVVSTDPSTSVTQNVVEVVSTDPVLHESQNAIEVVESPLTTIRLTQNAIDVVERPQPPPVNTTQFWIEVVGRNLFFTDGTTICVIT